MNRAFASLSLTALLAACGGSSDRSNAPESVRLERGEVQVTKPAGDAADEADASSTGGAGEVWEAVFSDGSMMGMQPGLMVAIGNKADICARLSNFAVPRNSSFFGFGLLKASGQAPSVGKYELPGIAPENFLYAQDYQFDQDCAAMPRWAEAGELELTSLVDGVSAAGKFSVTFEPGAQPMVGEFHASYCKAHQILESGDLSQAACVD